jgi:hypothetical protein
MNIQTIKNQTGVFSLVWALLGFLLWILWFHNFTGENVLLLTIFTAWWGIALLLALVASFCGSPTNKLAGLVTGFLFIFFLLWLPRIHT